jgi:hypothetical protein
MTGHNTLSLVVTAVIVLYQRWRWRGLAGDIPELPDHDLQSSAIGVGMDLSRSTPAPAE